MANINISSFFGGFGSKNNTSFPMIDFTEYNSIRTGTYKKLLKKYYAQESENSTSKQDKTNNKYNKVVTKDTTGLTKMRKEASELKKTADKLSGDDVWKKSNGAYDMEGITSAVKSFVNEYNDVIDQSAKVSTKDVAQQTGFMKNMTETMKKSLSSVGVSVGTDGKLTVDEEAFKKADMKNVKALFSGDYSYASQIAQKASGITSAAVRNSSLYSGTGLYANAIPGMYDDWA